VAGDLVVNQRAITLTALQQERTYGDPLSLDETAFSVLDLDGDASLPNGEQIDTVALNSVTGIDASTTANVGTYADEIAITDQNGSNGFEAGNYDLSYVAGDLVVNQRAVTLTALQQERTYGNPLSLEETAFSVLDLDGDATLPNGEVIDTVALNSVTGIDASTTANVGVYAEEITITGQNGSNGFEAGNYNLSYVAGDLVVNQRAVTLTALQQERGYGTTLALDPEAFTILDLDGDGNLPNGEMIDTLDLTSVGGLAGDRSVFPDLYPDNIVPSGQSGSAGFLAENYTITYEPGDLFIKGFPAGTALLAEGAIEDYFYLIRGIDNISEPFGLTNPPSRSATMAVFGFPEWKQLSGSARAWVRSMIDQTPDEKLTREYLFFLVQQACTHD
jgi:hypothetical protein